MADIPSFENREEQLIWYISKFFEELATVYCAADLEDTAKKIIALRERVETAKPLAIGLASKMIDNNKDMVERLLKIFSLPVDEEKKLTSQMYLKFAVDFTSKESVDEILHEASALIEKLFSPEMEKQRTKLLKIFICIVKILNSE